MASCSGIGSSSNPEMGVCGICKLSGPLPIVEKHFLTTHMTQDSSKYADEDFLDENLSETPDQYESMASSEDNASNWDQPESKLLLDKYEQYLPRVGPMKMFKRKKDMWKQISKDISTILKTEKTALQCENRYKTILKRKKKAVDNNHTSGSSRTTVEYETEIALIAAQDDSIEPEVMRDPNKVTYPKRAHESDVELSDSSARKKRVRAPSVQEVLVKLNDAKEEARERRHQEKMELIKTIFQSKKD